MLYVFSVDNYSFSVYNMFIMKKKIHEQEEAVISKIEIDEKTAEPVLVEVPLDEIPQIAEEETEIADSGKKEKVNKKEI